MASGDDSFIREVNEDLRQEKLQKAWHMLKPFIIGGAIAIILIVIGVEAYSYYSGKQAQKMGDQYIEALKLADAGPSTAAFDKLAQIEKNGSGGYPMLAQFRQASLLVQKNDKQSAVSAFQNLANNTDLPKPWRELASIRAAYLLVDVGSYADVEKQIKDQASDVSPMRFAAREALGLSAWKAGDLQKASYYFNRNYSDNGSEGMGFANRASMMISLISSQSGKHLEQAENLSSTSAMNQKTDTNSNQSSAN